MQCTSPLKGYRSRFRSKNGKYFFTMKPHEAFLDLPMTVACGQCMSCRLTRSRNWAIRCVHEASLHDHNSFITLTFNDLYLNKDRNLCVRDFQLFMKRLRRAHSDIKIKFFHCGEYGEEEGRPHHHACIFGYDFPDKLHWSTRDGIRLYRSPELEKLWGKGFCTIGDVTFESAAYVARYVTKKLTFSKASKDGDFDKYVEKYCYGVDKETGEPLFRHPEYVTMSRRPGIAFDWIMKYSSDVFPDDFVVIRNGIKTKPPKYYDSIYDDYLGDIDSVKAVRKSKAQARKEDNEFDRLLVKEELQKIRFNKLKRSL